ncbi:hypothetical protein FKM82_001802 [Ascaphus truei]
MAPWNVLALVLALQVLHTATGSMVKLNNGGYEDIVIAINPGIPEDVRIIENIQNMVKEATNYLFHATKKRLFIRSAKILIPLSWSQSNNYTQSKTETYDKADVIIADPFLKYGEDPYTLQYGGCGEQGRYIHLTPSFLLDDKLASVYGPRGRVLVHEWAHLRWGVFDEYNTETPYYIAGNLKVEATRCSEDIIGTNTMQCPGNSCGKACHFDPKTGLYEEGCVFVPEKNQFAKESIMYMQALSSVSEFCDASTHNTEAPTLQNRMCNYRSTWDVIVNSTDIKSTAPLTNTNIPAPSFSLLQYRDRVVTLVLDVSGSMGADDRITRMKQAADIFLIQIIETDSYVGLVKFESSASPISQLVQIITAANRETLQKLLPTAAGGGTNICAGIRSGFEVSEITMNPPRPVLNDDDLQLTLGAFSRTASGGSFIVTNVPPGPQPDIYRPEKITDLEAKIEENKIVLSWTATGDDLDQGNASKYDLRMGINPKELRINFETSTSVNISSLTPLPAGSSETFTFVPNNIVIQNGTILYFALIAFDKVSQKSDLSNIAQAALLIPPAPNPTTVLPPAPTHTRNDDSEKLSITALALIVCGTVIVMCLIISIAVCIVSCQKKKKTKHPEMRL